jgi:hypothetical protein
MTLLPLRQEISRRRLLKAVGSSIVVGGLIGPSEMASAAVRKTSGIPSSPAGPTAPHGGWSVKFSDDFPGTSLNRSKWFPGFGPHYDTSSPNTSGANADGSGGAPSGEFQLYTPGNVTVSNSSAALTLKAQSITGDPDDTHYSYTSGCLCTYAVGGTSPGYSFNGGTRTVVSASIKIPPAFTGSWPAFWCTGPFDGWLYEVDIFELYDSTVNPQQNLHYTTGGAPYCNAQAGPYSHYVSSSSLANAFHVYSADINANGQGRTDFYIDGTRITSLTAAGYGTEMFIFLNLALNSASPPHSSLPASMYIDWVAVYQPG